MKMMSCFPSSGFLVNAVYNKFSLFLNDIITV